MTHFLHLYRGWIGQQSKWIRFGRTSRWDVIRFNSCQIHFDQSRNSSNDRKISKRRIWSMFTCLLWRSIHASNWYILKFIKKRFRFHQDELVNVILFSGLSDIPGEAMVKIYCPKCIDVYNPKSSRHHHTDGAYFGTGFPHMLFMVHPEYRPKRPTNQFVPRYVHLISKLFMQNR